MFAITTDIVQSGILKYDIENEKEYNGKIFIFLNSNETLNSCFFDEIFNIQKSYGCDIEYRYSEKYNSIVIVIY